MVFVRNNDNLDQIQEVCLDQSWNNCLTARYEVFIGENFFPILFMKFINDLNLDRYKKKKNLSQNTVVGKFLPNANDQLWNKIRDNCWDFSYNSLPEIAFFFNSLSDSLKEGDRFILLCEIKNFDKTTDFFKEFFFDKALDLLTFLPERFGIIFSGISEPHILPLGENSQLIEIEGIDEIDLNKNIERNQPIENDNASGDDRLGITVEINSLADAIAANDMQPPFVLGILGGWGNGKSFVMHLLKNRLRFIRKIDITNHIIGKQYPYIGHPYLVQFDAWTFAKNDLWASLMQKILYDLNQQLSIEQYLKDAKVDIKKGIDIWKLTDDLSTDQLKAFSEELGIKTLKNFTQWDDAKQLSQALWDALEKNRSAELKKLGKAKLDLQKRRTNFEIQLHKLRESFEEKLGKIRVVNEIKTSKINADYFAEQKQVNSNIEVTKARILLEEEQKTLGIARKAAWNPIKDQINATFNNFLHINLIKSEGMENNAPISIWEVFSKVNLLRKWIYGISPQSCIYILLAITLPVCFAWISKYIPTYVSTVFGSTTFLGGLFASIYSSINKVNKLIVPLQNDYQSKINAQLDSLTAEKEASIMERHNREITPLEKQLAELEIKYQNDLKTKNIEDQENINSIMREEQEKIDSFTTIENEKIASLEKTVKDHIKRAGIPGQSKSINELVKTRIECGDYDQKCGLLNQVQLDLEELTNALIPRVGKAGSLFPRGDPRIFLFIDDLDRCPPEKVIQVLEAIQLLVKTRLFVVIVSMDVRYITRALEKFYEGILLPNGDPSGLDYIEKIVQLPYRIRPISPQGISDYIESLIQVNTTAVPGENRYSNQIPQITGSKTQISSPRKNSERIENILPTIVQEFSPEEVEALEKSVLQTALSPRSIKRITNVMKLIKTIWYREDKDDPGIEIKKTMMVLLSLSAKFPEIMRRLLFELENKYQDNSSTSLRIKVKAALKELCSQWSQKENNKEGWETIQKKLSDETLVPSNISLQDLELSNLQLIQAFSFVGELTSIPVDKVIQQHEVSLLTSSNLMHLESNNNIQRPNLTNRQE